MTVTADPGLADRIRHAARVSQASAPSVRINPRVVGGVLVPDRLTVERRRWRHTSESRYRVLDMVRFLRCSAGMRYWIGLFRLNVWWMRQGIDQGVWR